jgi:hypothetical protein
MLNSPIFNSYPKKLVLSLTRCPSGKNSELGIQHWSDPLYVFVVTLRITSLRAGRPEQ